MVFNNMLLWGDSGVMDTVTVTIVGRNVVKEYDGSTQSISGYTITSISNPDYSASDIIFSGSAATSGKNVGTYNMGLSSSQFTNVNTRFKNVVFAVTDGYVRISPKNVTVAAVAKSKTYDNNSGTDPALTATVTGLIGADTITYTISRVSGQNAGQYTITPAGNATQGNYVVNYSTAKFTINPASCTLTANSGTKTYNKASQSVTGYTCSVSGLAFSGVSASGSGTNAGTYAVTFSGVTINTTKDTTGNYKVTGVTNGVLTINPANCTLTANSGTKTYNGSNQSVTGFSSNPSGLSFSGVSASGTGKNAGTYSVTFSGVTINTTRDTTGNYKVTGTTNGTLTINKASLGLSITSYNGTYNGSAHTITATVSVTSGTTIYYSTDNTNWSTTKPTRTVVGTTTVYVKAQNTDTTNYAVATGTGTITITKAAASALGLSVSGWSGTYDGSSHTITATVSVASGTTLYYRTSTTASWSTTKPSRTAVGTTTVYVEARNDNYNTASGNANIVINSKAVTVKADNKSKTYGQNDPTLTATVTGTVGSDTVSYTLSRAAGSNVGNYTITPSGNKTQGNYTVTFQTGTFTINKASSASLGLSVTSYDKMYDGAYHSVTATVAVSSGTTIYYKTDSTSWSTTNPSFKDIGYNAVYVKAVNSNYNDATANGSVYIEGNVLISLSSQTTFYIQSQDGTYESETYTLPAGQFWFDYLSPGRYYFVNETTGLYSMFTTNNYTYVTVP